MSERRETPKVLEQDTALAVEDTYVSDIVTGGVVVQLHWDYAALDMETRIVVQQRTHEIRVLMRTSAQSVIDIGVKLIEVKARLGYGNFGPWLKAEFDWSVPSAARFMQVAVRFGDGTIYQIDNFAPSALYALAAPSTPEEARQEAIARASNGESITHAAAKEIIAEYKPTPPRTVSPTPAGNGRTFKDREFYSAVDAARDKYEPAYQVDGPAPPAWVEEDLEEETDELDAGPVNIEDRWGSVETVGQPAPMAVHFSSETPEHYTPDVILAAVVACMGGIDLDPCSNSHETPNVPAAEHYTRADDGLAQTWRGGVFMNPPYGREIDPWIAKLVSEYEDGAVTEAIALVPARTDTQWWQRLRDYHICFVTGRLAFKGAGNNESAPFPSAVVYLGNDTDRFVNTFEGIGDVWHRTRHGFCFGE